MHVRWRSRPTRVVLTLLAVMAVAAAIALGLWGTRWTVPRAATPRAGYLLRAAWDGKAIPGGELERPIGIAVGPSGDVYVTDAQLRVVRFNSAGEFLGQWGGEGDGRGEFRNPVGVAVDRNGAVFISDYEQDRIQKFTPAGEFLLEFGRSGSRPGEFNAPAGVTITARRELLVADAYNYQLQWFDLEGQPLRRVGYHLFWLWPRPVTSAAGFFVPSDAAAGRDGIVHVSDSGNHRVVMLSEEGEYAAEWRIADANPNVYSPEHIAVSLDGSTIYATDLAGNRVLVLTVTSGS